jgi:hypothetical protein
MSFLKSLFHSVGDRISASALKQFASDVGQTYVRNKKDNPHVSHMVLVHMIVEIYYKNYSDEDALQKMRMIYDAGSFYALEGRIQMMATVEGVGPDISGYSFGKELLAAMAYRDTIIRDALKKLGIGEKERTGEGITTEEVDAYNAWKIDHPPEKRWRGN